MSKLLQNPKVVVSLGVVAALYLGYSMYPKKKMNFTMPADAPVLEMPVLADPPPAPTLYSDTGSGLIDKIRWKRKANRNPFQEEKRKGKMASWVLGQGEEIPPPFSPQKKTKKSPSYSLQAVAIGPGGRLALVNGHWLQEGSRWGNLRVLAVAEDSVSLLIGSKRSSLSFLKGR